MFILCHSNFHIAINLGGLHTGFLRLLYSTYANAPNISPQTRMGKGSKKQGTLKKKGDIMQTFKEAIQIKRWGNWLTGYKSRSGSRSRSHTRNHKASSTNSPALQERQAALKGKIATKREQEKMNAIFANPKKGDVIYDPEEPENSEKHLIWNGHDWEQAIDIFGDYGIGPAAASDDAAMRKLLANKQYREEKAELNALKAEASGESISDKVLKEALAGEPADVRERARAQYAILLGSMSNADKRDATKLAAKARRAITVATKALSKKGGSRRMPRRRRTSRKTRKMTRRR